MTRRVSVLELTLPTRLQLTSQSWVWLVTLSWPQSPHTIRQPLHLYTLIRWQHHTCHPVNTALYPLCTDLPSYRAICRLSRVCPHPALSLSMYLRLIMTVLPKLLDYSWRIKPGLPFVNKLVSYHYSWKFKVHLSYANYRSMADTHYFCCNTIDVISSICILKEKTGQTLPGEFFFTSALLLPTMISFILMLFSGNCLFWSCDCLSPNPLH